MYTDATPHKANMTVTMPKANGIISPLILRSCRVKTTTLVYDDNCLNYQHRSLPNNKERLDIVVCHCLNTTLHGAVNKIPKPVVFLDVSRNFVNLVSLRLNY